MNFLAIFTRPEPRHPARYVVATKAESRAAADKKRATTEALRRYVTEQRLVEAVRRALEDVTAELARDEQMRGRS